MIELNVIGRESENQLTDAWDVYIAAGLRQPGCQERNAQLHAAPGRYRRNGVHTPPKRA